MYPRRKAGRSDDVSGAIALPEPSGPILNLDSTLARGPSVRARDAEEQELVERCLAGDVEAFRPLVVRYQRMALSVALHMLGSRADAEDVVQHGFTDAFDNLYRFSGDGRERAFSNWLIRIVVNRSKDVLKSKRRTETPLDRDVQGRDAAFAYDAADPETSVAGRQERQRLEAALLAVAPKYREVLILKDVEELSYEEIRSILRLPITTLKIRVVRARAMLRETLASDGGTTPHDGKGTA
jgi:RNA polymerase sigma-70 factor (ECF subfamily)